MLEKLGKFYNVFRAGQSVVEAVRLKKMQAAGGLVAGLFGALIAMMKAYGYDIPLTDDQLLQIGGAVVAVFGLFNAGATVASTDKLGLPASAVPDLTTEVHGVPPVSAALIAEAEAALERDRANTYRG